MHKIIFVNDLDKITELLGLLLHNKFYTYNILIYITFCHERERLPRVHSENL